MAIISITAATAVSTITDDLQHTKKDTIEKEGRNKYDSAANDDTTDMDLTSTTTATTDSSVLITPK
eukprot:15059224-Ditylum_brightwellii.AAC.1